MSWDSTFPILVRNAIGDFSATSKYSDEQLLPVILTACQAVIFKLQTPLYSYVVDIENLALSPDPTDAATPDNAFIYITTLKASSMLLRAEVRQYGQQAIAIRDGTSAIDLKRDLKALSALADSYTTEADTAILTFLRNNSLSARAVVSPYKTLLGRLDRYFYDNNHNYGQYY